MLKIMDFGLPKPSQNPSKMPPKSAALLAAPGVLEPTAFYACINMCIILLGGDPGRNPPRCGQRQAF